MSEEKPLKPLVPKEAETCTEENPKVESSETKSDDSIIVETESKEQVS